MIKQLLLIFSIIFIIWMVILYFFQRNLLYFPAKEMPSREAFQAEDMQLVHIKTQDGLTLYSWYKAALPHKPTLLYFHGNAGHIGYRMSLVRQFLLAGFGVFLLEYRGYGGNEGQPSELGLYQDGEAALRFLQQQGIPPSRLVLYGESLGTGVVTHLATQFRVCAVVLQSPYTSMSKLARYHYPWVFIPPWDKFDSLARISKIKSPLLILHGTHDAIVPHQQALLLFQRANDPKELISLPGRGHNDLWDDGFSQKVVKFIETHCT
ncbi:Bem46 protein [Legionella lansingensis]|uniref:Alpha/beta hydrolase family protein n=1 Tax=Legionella lansingensis TaxID=45067 RepID=A0A0W0VRG7_9GAMM|nr:alpha/beta fold hydrolase [Legionella lansingensis]KTD22748.1 Alpha/beta hydrolase family protein [Legionella lansingensis]SNV56831.1 Bem46 protein [Legionella lansingensis]